MKERPILFSGPMVRAILAGTKTQTRRIVKTQGTTMAREILPNGVTVGWRTNVRHDYGDTTVNVSPYGAPGDRLWVRETVYKGPPQGASHDSATYAADGLFTVLDTWPWKASYLPSIHMPRGLCRITLEVLSVRVERLRDISEEDAKTEGLTPITKDGGRTIKYGIPDRDGYPGTDDDGWPWCDWSADPRVAFRTLWDSINADRAPWASNPWVWVVEFKRIG